MDNEYLKKIMSLLNIGQFDLAKASGVNRSVLQEFLSGHRQIKSHQELSITKAIEKLRQKKIKELESF